MFNMIRNLGGAIGIAVLQTVLAQREQFHSDIITAQVSLLGQASRDRLQAMTHRFMMHGVSDPAFAQHEAAVAVARIVRRQASILAFSDTVIFQSVLLGVALLLVLMLKKAKTGPAGEAH